jgi:hypothetical protein
VTDVLNSPAFLILLGASLHFVFRIAAAFVLRKVARNAQNLRDNNE